MFIELFGYSIFVDLQTKASFSSYGYGFLLTVMAVHVAASHKLSYELALY